MRKVAWSNWKKRTRTTGTEALAGCTVNERGLRRLLGVSVNYLGGRVRFPYPIVYEVHHLLVAVSRDSRGLPPLL